MVRTRFAPSPTGYIHIGNVRSAIYPYLIAKQNGGKFILRIEDTDRMRYVEGATELIMDTLRWLGLEWDEGPEVGGPNVPYFQSERKEIYHRWAKKLIESGRAYADPTAPEVIDGYRKEDSARKVPFLYRNHRPTETSEWHEGIPLRFKAEPKAYQWHDEVMGDLSTGPEVCDDIILIKKDGLPTYNFAHIVDDAEMGVTHVLRGVEYLSSMPNYLALYEALGLEKPKFLSLPHILAPQGNKKLSKRDGAKSVTDYRADGILAEAMLNYLACLGWNDGTEQEIYSMEELLSSFTPERIQSSGARFDEVKLLWTNGQWIRKIATESAEPASEAIATARGIDELYIRTKGFWPEEAKEASEEYKKRVLAIIYDRLKTLSDLRTMTGYFFAEPEIDLKMITENKYIKKIPPETSLETLLRASIEKLDTLAVWDSDGLQEALNDLLEETGRKPAELFSLLRLALSFAPFSPALNLTMEVLGKEATIRRLSAVKSRVS